MNPNITPQEPIQELESPNRDIEQKSQPEPSLAAASTTGSKDSDKKHKKEKNPKRLHRKHKIALAILTTLISIAVVSVAVVGFWFLMTISAVRPDVAVNGEVVVIEPNSSLETIAAQLSDKDLIKDKNAFVLYAKFGPARGKLQPGPYLIKPTNSIKQIVSDMSGGKIAISKITFPEGITLNEMAKRWSSAGYGSKDEYIAATKKLAPEFDFIPVTSRENPEGYLFPATYKFTVNSPAEVLVRQQYQAFAINALPILQGKRPAGLSENEVLVLASIVEKEALTTEDRKLTAGVFLNRLAIGMKLESDVTVNYTTGNTQTTPADIAIPSAYNTYRIKALPPTPINNPSTESIEAVMNPTKSDYLFFLAGNDGVVYYATNFEKHNENIKNHL